MHLERVRGQQLIYERFARAAAGRRRGLAAVQSFDSYLLGKRTALLPDSVSRLNFPLVLRPFTFLSNSYGLSSSFSILNVNYTVTVSGSIKKLFTGLLCSLQTQSPGVPQSLPRVLWAALAGAHLVLRENGINFTKNQTAGLSPFLRGLKRTTRDSATSPK